MEGPTGSLQGPLDPLSVGPGTAGFLLIFKIYLNSFLKRGSYRFHCQRVGSELPFVELGLRNSGPTRKRQCCLLCVHACLIVFKMFFYCDKIYINKTYCLDH